MISMANSAMMELNKKYPISCFINPSTYVQRPNSTIYSLYDAAY